MGLSKLNKRVKLEASYYQMLLFIIIISTSLIAAAGNVPFSDEASFKLDKALEKASPETKQCISCHITYTPFIVMDWLRSKMAWITPAEG